VSLDQPQAHQQSVHVPIGANAGHGLLADVTTLGEAYGAFDPTDLLRQIRLIDVYAVFRHAGFDPQRVIHVESRRPGAGVGERLP
jgi:hypothetical protein